MKIRLTVYTDIPDAMVPSLLKKAGVKFKGEADTVLGLNLLGLGGAAGGVRALLLDPERGDTQYDQPYAVTTEESEIQVAIEVHKPLNPLPVAKKAAKKAVKKTTARKRKAPAKGGQTQ